MLRMNKTSSIQKLPSLLLTAAVLTVAATPVLAEADGPDAWRVANVSPDSSLNVRIGPGTDYPRIDSLAADTRHLRYTECVPYINPGIWENFTPAQQQRFGDLHRHWCYVITEEFVKGWVNKFYLAEDSLPEEPADSGGQSGGDSQ